VSFPEGGNFIAMKKIRCYSEKKREDQGNGKSGG
jgi:hypothetical protein